MNRSIVWFKTDLRLHDNETLMQAIAQSDEIVPVYCLDDAHFVTTNFGFKKTGNFRADFLLESLKYLDANLRALGSGLVIVKGNPAVEIPELAKKYSATKVFAQQEIADEEIKTQQRVVKALEEMNIAFKTYSTDTLYHLEDLPFTINDIPDVFTNFRKRVEKESALREAFQKPTRINSPAIEQMVLPSLQELSLDEIATDERAAIAFQGGETEAWKRLRHFFFETKCLSTYKETRNGLVGADYSSKFSAWIALGCISARSIHAQVKKYEQEIGANESTYWLVFELLWRDYFRWMMKKYGNAFFKKHGISGENKYENNYDETVFAKWMNGETGADFIDANMRELKLTGFMSNRGRQNVASYLCHYLKQDWRYGAAYFEQQLIDYDVCSNWGNWAYLAGVGNDPRSNRIFNIEKQASDYDKNKTYRNLWLNKI
jgi:deoxyribodipyrimidine photo-lyase